ncbi:MAG: SDR family oxidoreductase [Phycisphaerae bacterium]|nr:SDR family oxidoreductase [Phycisphaerae bacterium]
MNLNLTGKRALVCGSTQGIGLAAATEIAALGASVTLLARNGESLKAAAEGLPAKDGQNHDWLAADFAKPEEVRSAVEGHLDPARPYHILVNNSGGPPPGTALDIKPADLLACLNAQLVCAVMLAQVLVPQFRAAGYGRIINVISTSVKQPIPNLGVSNTVRAAVASWAKTLSAEVGPWGVTVNNVLPGYTSTERLASLIKGRAAKSGATEEKVAQDLIATIPAGRFGKPEELGAAIAFLASPAAGYISGINLPVDGGRLGCL